MPREIDEKEEKEKIKNMELDDIEKVKIKDPSKHHKQKRLPDIVEKTWQKTMDESTGHQEEK